MKILAYLNTYNRYESTLPMALLSLINQTRKPDHITIFDDNKEPKDLRNIEHYKYLFDLMDQKGIGWNYVFAEKKGAHYSHEKANMMGYDAAYFIDDDNVAESNVLEELEKLLVDGVGAVGGLILKPPASILPTTVRGRMEDVFNGQNVAWYTWEGRPKEVEHLYSGFLYRCNIVHHDLRLSKKVFRGETMFTHSLFLKGYKLIVTPKAITWHFESRVGGCRTPEDEKTNTELYQHDNLLFNEWLNFQKTGKNLVFLNSGKGDHYMALQSGIITPGSVVACCYPECFSGMDLEIISIDQGSHLVDPKDYDIYKWCSENRWKGTLIDAYSELYKQINKKYGDNVN